MDGVSGPRQEALSDKNAHRGGFADVNVSHRGRENLDYKTFQKKSHQAISAPRPLSSPPSELPKRIPN